MIFKTNWSLFDLSLILENLKQSYLFSLYEYLNVGYTIVLSFLLPFKWHISLHGSQLNKNTICHWTSSRAPIIIKFVAFAQPVMYVHSS